MTLDAKQRDAAERETGRCMWMRGGRTSLAATPAMPLHAHRGMQLNATQDDALGASGG
jgi:hypothetical protein